MMRGSTEATRAVGRAGGGGRSAGFSMVEVLLAAMILAVGFIMMLPAFTVGMNESRRAAESSIAIQLGQNAEGYCRALLDTYNDENFVEAKVQDKQVHRYEFRGPSSASRAIPGFTFYRARDNWQVFTDRPADFDNVNGWTDKWGHKFDSRYERLNYRVYGDPAKSKYYWSLLYRFPYGNRSLVELWIMVCKRDRSSPDNTLAGIEAAALLTASASAGEQEFNAGSAASFLEPDTGAVTDRGEVLPITGRSGSSVRLRQPLSQSFQGVWIVPADGNLGKAGNSNSCISVFHTYVASKAAP